MTLNVLEIIISSIAGIGIFAGGLGYFISLFKSGSRKMMSDQNEYVVFYKTENQNLKDIIKEKDASNDAKFQAMSKEIGEIRGQLIEKEKQNKAYLEILQNRDPDTLKFQELMTKACIDQGSVNTEIVKILKDIHQMAVIEHERDIKVTSIVTKS
jgi:hypothetical protein